MNLTSGMLLVIYITTSHQEELDNFMTSVEPNDTIKFDSDTTFGVLPSDVLQLDYSTPDTTEKASLTFTHTDHIETNDYSLGDATDSTSSSDTFTETTSTDLLTTAESGTDSTAPLVDTTSAPIDTTFTPTKTTRPTTSTTTTTISYISTVDTTSAPINTIIPLTETPRPTMSITTTINDNTSTAPLVDTTIAPINTTSTPTEPTRATTPITTTIANHISTVDTTSAPNDTNFPLPETPRHTQSITTTTVNTLSTTSTTVLFNHTYSSNAGDKNDDSKTYVIVGAVVGGAAGAGAAIAIAILAWRYRRRRKLNWSDECTPGLKDGAASSSQRGPNTYILSMSSNVRSETATSAVYGNAAEANELNTLRVTAANVNACPDNDAIYNNTKPSPSKENDDLYNNTAGALMMENDDVCVTTDIHSNVDNGRDSEAKNEGIYEKPNVPRSSGAENFYEPFDVAPITEEDFLYSNDKVKKLHQDAHNANETARLSTDSLYSNVPKELPPISLRDNATAPRTGKSPGPVSPHSGYHKSPIEVCVKIDEIQTKADDPNVKDNEYVNIKSVKTLRDENTSVAEDDVLAEVRGDKFGPANAAGLDNVYNNTEQAKR